MNTDWLVILTKRFLKMFILGGLSSALVIIAQSPTIDLTNWKSWVAVVVTAFLTGGLAAVEKWTQGWNPQ